MPTYTFKNKETGEIVEKVMKISEYDTFMSSNPHFERYHESTGVAIVDPASVGLLKPPSDFQKYVIDGIQRINPGASRGSKYGIPKEW